MHDEDSERLSWFCVMALAAVAVLADNASWQPAQADPITSLPAAVIATNIPGASAIAQVGIFLNEPPLATPPAFPPVSAQCANPIPTKFASFIQSGKILDSRRLLVGSLSNFGAPSASDVGRDGSFLSIDPSGPTILSIRQDFAASGGQASDLNGAVQMFSANSPHWRNSVNNPPQCSNRFVYWGEQSPRPIE
jgi:hypothetical protein